MDTIHNSFLDEVVNSEKHAELIAGRIVIEDKTTTEHNDVIMDIVFALKSYIAANNGKCRVFSENVALYVNELCDDDKNFFLPDVMVVCDAEGIKSDGVHTTPLFVAEVTSESTKTFDYHEKMEIYRKIGVSEYWIVDLQKKVVQKYLKAEDYIPQTYIYPESMKVSVYPNLMIDLSSNMK